MYAITHVVQLDPALVAKLVGIVCPILVAMLARSTAAAGLKAVLNAVLAVVAGGLAAAITTKGKVDLSVIADGSLWAAVTAWASYNGFWKPTGVAPTLLAKPGLIGPSESAEAA